MVSEEENKLLEASKKTFSDFAPWPTVLPGVGGHMCLWYFLAMCSGIVPIYASLPGSLRSDRGFGDVLKVLFTDQCVDRVDDVIMPIFLIAGVALSVGLPVYLFQIRKLSTDEDMGKFYQKLDEKYKDFWPNYKERRKFYFRCTGFGNMCGPVILLVSFIFWQKGVLAIFGIALFFLTSIILHLTNISASILLAMSFFCLYSEILQMLRDKDTKVWYWFDGEQLPATLSAEDISELLKKYMQLEKGMHTICEKISNVLWLMFVLCFTWMFMFFIVGVLLTEAAHTEHCHRKYTPMVPGATVIISGVMVFAPALQFATILYLFASHTSCLHEGYVHSKSLLRAMLAMAPNVQGQEAHAAYHKFLQYLAISKSGAYLSPVGVFTSQQVFKLAGQFFTIAFSLYGYLSHR